MDENDKSNKNIQNPYIMLYIVQENSLLIFYNYIPRRKSGIYWIQVRRAAAAVEISLWTR